MCLESQLDLLEGPSQQAPTVHCHLRLLKLTLSPWCFKSLSSSLEGDVVRWKSLGGNLRDLAFIPSLLHLLCTLDNQTLTFPLCKMERKPSTHSDLMKNRMDDSTAVEGTDALSAQAYVNDV